MSQQTSTASRRRGRFRRREGKSSLQMIEEGFHLLRTASARTHWAYLLGTVPFVAAVYYFWADMGRSSYADRDSSIASLGMVAAYFWMKAWHAVFCRRLVASINPGQTVVFTGWKKVRYFAAQMLLQAFAVPALLIAALAFFPLPWVYAFFQNVSALGFSKDYSNRPLRELFFHAANLAVRDWGQCVGILFLMKFVALFTWLNLVAASVAVNFFGKSFFDIESAFTTSPMAAYFNTTFIFGSFLIAFLILAPLMKAIFVLRCFYADSRETGADLLSQLSQFSNNSEPGQTRSSKPETRKFGAAGAAVLFFVMITPAYSQDELPVLPAAPGNANVTPGDLQESIRDTMAQKKYQWRFERLEGEGGEEAEKTGIAKLLEDFAESVNVMIKSVNNSMEKFFDRLFGRDKPQPDRGNTDVGDASGMGIPIQTSLMVALYAVLGGLVIWLIYVLIKRHREEGPVEVDDPGVGGMIDLESENIIATQLHEDEWMALAREKIAAGETRLAIRALFLASLAHLGDRGMLHIKKFKSNYDYSTELRLKARSLPELQEAFGENIGLFERVWYGLHQIGDEAVQHFTANYERIAAQKSVHELQQAEVAERI